MCGFVSFPLRVLLRVQQIRELAEWKAEWPERVDAYRTMKIFKFYPSNYQVCVDSCSVVCVCRDHLSSCARPVCFLFALTRVLACSCVSQQSRPCYINRYFGKAKPEDVFPPSTDGKPKTHAALVKQQ
jgi:hypothetical protein